MIKIYKNFVKTEQEDLTAEQRQDFNGHTFLYIHDETGRDWYDIQRDWQRWEWLPSPSIQFIPVDENGVPLYEVPKTEVMVDQDLENYKIIFEKTGHIRYITKDITTAWPINGSLAVVSPDIVPEGVTSDQRWIFDGEKIFLSVERQISDAEYRRTALMLRTTNQINLLVAAEEDGDITPEEDEKLAKLRAYRIALRRLDVSKVVEPGFVWPELAE